MRRRRLKSRRNRRKRIVKTIKYLLIIAMLSGIVYTTSIFFKINDIEILGNTKYLESDILQSIPIKVDDSMFFVDKTATTDIILADYPYVSEVLVTRKLPDTISIEIKEAKPFATILQDGNYNLIDTKGKILEVVTLETAKTFPRIFGIDIGDLTVSQNIINADNEKGNELISILDYLVSYNKLENTNEINLILDYDINFLYADRFEVHLGNASDLDHKMKVFEEFLKKLTPSDKGIIDISEKGMSRYIPKDIIKTPFFGDDIITLPQDDNVETEEE